MIVFLRTLFCNFKQKKNQCILIPQSFRMSLQTCCKILLSLLIEDSKMVRMPTSYQSKFNLSNIWVYFASVVLQFKSSVHNRDVECSASHFSALNLSQPKAVIATKRMTMSATVQNIVRANCVKKSTLNENAHVREARKILKYHSDEKWWS